MKKKYLGKRNYNSIIQVTIFMLCINSVCIATVQEFNDIDEFEVTAGVPQRFIDFETYGDGTPVPEEEQPVVTGDEWLLNFGVQFDAIANGGSLLLYNDPPGKGEYVSRIHTLAAAGGSDSTSYLITFSTPVVSFGMYIVDSEITSITEEIILKDSSGNTLGEFAMPVDPNGPFNDGYISKDFRGYISDIPIAEVYIIEDLDGEGLSLDNVMYTVPEPATVLLVGLGGLAVLRRRSGQNVDSRK